LTKRVERVVEHHEIEICAGRREPKRAVERHANVFAAAFVGAMRPGVIHKDAAHDARGHREEMGAILPIDPRCVDQPEIGLIGESRRLKGVPGTLAPHVTSGQPPQFLVDERRQLIERLLTPTTPRAEQTRDFWGLRCRQARSLWQKESLFDVRAVYFSPAPPPFAEVVMGLQAWVLAVVLGIPAIAGAGQSDQAVVAAPSSRVRPTTAAVAVFLKSALPRSGTLRDLAAAIEASDLLVFVEISNEPGPWRGATRFASTSVHARMVIVTINGGLDAREKIAVLGHELQHVCEVAADRTVTDQGEMRHLFERIGHLAGPSAGVYETASAQRIERLVRGEIGKK
jgi:hypothetical protein